MRHVAVDAVDLALLQLPDHVRVEVDDDGLLQQAPALAARLGRLQLIEDRAGVTEEAEEDQPVIGELSLRLGRHAVEVMDAEPLEKPADRLGDGVVVADQVGAGHRGDGEGDDHDADDGRADLAAGQAQGGDHDREFADLGQVDAGHQADPVSQPEPVEDREDDRAAQHQEAAGSQGGQDQAEAGDGDHHAEGDEEERHEEVAEVGHLGDHVDVVGEGREADPRDQGAHLPGEADEAGGPGQEEAPGQRGREDQLGLLRHRAEEPGQDVAADGQAPEDQQHAFQEGGQQRRRVGVRQVRLGGEHDDRPEILADQDPERDPAGERVQLPLVVEQLDHDQGAAHRQAGGQVEELELPAPVAKPEPVEEGQPQPDADRHLERAGDQHRPPGGDQLLQVDLQPDHEEEQDQPDLGHGLDARPVLDEVQTDRPDQNAGDQVGEDQRLPEPMPEERQQRRGGDADADAGEKIAGDLQHGGSRNYSPYPQDLSFDS